MHYYAQIDENNICVGMMQSEEPVTAPDTGTIAGAGTARTGADKCGTLRNAAHPDGRTG